MPSASVEYNFLPVVSIFPPSLSFGVEWLFCCHGDSAWGVQRGIQRPLVVLCTYGPV